MVGNKREIISQKSVFIISAVPVADGQGASYARMMAYAKALTVNKGLSVYLISIKYPDKLIENKKEVRPGIFICGTENTANRNSGFVKRTSAKLFGKAGFNNFLKNVSGFLDAFEGQRSVLVYPSINNYQDELALLKMVKSKGIPVFSERNELNVGKMPNYPFPENPIKKLLFAAYYPFRYYDHAKQDKLVTRYDGNIVISTTMEKRVALLNKNLIRIPILADVKKFVNAPKQAVRHGGVNIGYTGYLTTKKDGIPELIEAVSILKKKYGINDIHLNLYGTGYRGVVAMLKKQVASLGLHKQVTLYGKVNSDKIPAILQQQDLLMLTRPLNLQTQYGFSTKLAEYMASGTPVVVTGVSDNTLFVKDGVNGFVAKSHNAEEVAEKLYEIINKKKYLNEHISKNAIETAREHFSPMVYTETLTNFLFAS